MKTNFGYIYYKEFFTWLNISLKAIKDTKSDKLKYYFYPDLTEKDKKTTSEFGIFNNEFLASKINESDDINLFKKAPQYFCLKTVYPGLLSGSGYLHEVGENKDEFQLGFYFDYTTGLPVIPASSIKGVLRDACEMREGEYLIEKVEKALGRNKNIDKTYFTPIVKKIGKEEKKFPSEFVYNVFEGKLVEKEDDGTIKFDKQGKPITKGVSIYKRDIFFDAFPIKSKKTLFGSDYITHHEHPLKNPNPVKFLRVQPEVTYKFQFDLKDSNGLTAEQKKNIFKELILDLGLGAKTNVGYGQFERITAAELKEEENKKEYKRKQELKRQNPAYKSCGKKATAYTKDTKVDVTITQVGDYISMQDSEGSTFTKRAESIAKKFEKDLVRKQKKSQYRI